MDLKTVATKLAEDLNTNVKIINEKRNCEDEGILLENGLLFLKSDECNLVVEYLHNNVHHHVCVYTNFEQLFDDINNFQTTYLKVMNRVTNV